MGINDCLDHNNEKKYWFVIRTKPRKENVVKLAIEAKGLVALVPKNTVFKIVKGKKIKAEIILMTTYVFVQCSLTTIHTLNYIPGSIGILKFDNIPIYLSSSDIDRLEKLSKLSSLPKICEEHTVGKKVIIRGSVLDGFEGIIIKNNDKYIYLQSGINGINFKVDISKNDCIIEDIE